MVQALWLICLPTLFKAQIMVHHGEIMLLKETYSCQEQKASGDVYVLAANL